MPNLLDGFLEWSKNRLEESDAAKEFLYSRGSVDDQWSRHELGFINELYEPDPVFDKSHGEICEVDDKRASWCDTCRFINWSTSWDEKLKKNVAGKKLLNSVVYPLTTYSGLTLGIQVRSISEKNYDTFVLKKRPESYFFGTKFHVNKIWSRRCVALVEGPSDLLTLEKLIDIPVLALTTNSTNENQNRFLNRFCEKVYLFLDLDKAGRDGCEKITTKLSDEISVMTVNYKYKNESIKDINDMWKVLGPEKLHIHIKNLLSCV